MTIASSPQLDDLERLWPPAEAQALVRAKTPVLPVDHVSLNSAAGRFLAEDAVAGEDYPPFAAATMDGYAVVAEDASPWREVLGDQVAGTPNGPGLTVTEGTAVRITTGAPLPAGANAVVPVEATEPAEDHVIIKDEHVAAGANVRPIGSDIRAGELVLAAGTQLGPAALGLLASQGMVPVAVRRRPVASILATGDELVDPTEQPAAGQIRDSNRFSLAAALSEAGAEVAWSGKAPDQAAALRALLTERIAASDVVITSGGVSMGHLDLVKPLLGELATVHFRRLFLKPGKPLNFATVGETLLFGLPGNPVSALVTFELFIRPAIRQMMGAATIDRPLVPVRLAAPTRPSDRIEYQRATVRVTRDGVLEGVTTGAQQSSRLASFVGANALLVIAPRATPYQSGELVAAMLLAPPVFASNAG